MSVEPWSFPRAEQLPTYAFVASDAVKAKVRATGADLIDLGLGNPDHPTPQPIVEQLKAASELGKNHRYHPGRGLLELREAACEWYARRYHTHFTPDRHVMVTMGAKDGMTGLCLAILGQGDHVLSPDPAYPIHAGAPMIAGATVHTYPVGAPDQALVIGQRLRELAAQGQRVKLVILNYPHNPTGRVVSQSELKAIVEVVRDSGALLLHDMAYADLDFEHRHAPSIFDCGLPQSEVEHFAVEAFSMSKSYHMPGWRIAFMTGCPEMISALAHLKTYTDYGTFAPLQVAAAWALRNGDALVDEIRDVYQKRARALVQGLRRAGWSEVEEPTGTMFVWTRLPRALAHLDSFAAVAYLIENAHVAVSPGSGFGPAGEGYVRFALIEDPPRIQEACDRIARMLARLDRPSAQPIQPHV